ncbi:MAG: hypothetical protein COV01_01155 [Candidatus Taylorbacteria bacterium CG10_big_fil_rev_8_21_14_0_10_41_48]|uniref:Uncharacterized protein n=1 Tax=Candidatus Taylorbacteria bacterium CG10_big_fil_rev_8_21_14_0_10_41_48 TaxID=1975024 RepID=A0A2M8LDI4_9BACT|nr:MAG: hypothetical protein COV01_01155 [Candidatus Taylorbacteria bacterium CG10_big_fil_rev_8_21_14_0_10_41_48]
MSWSGKRKFGYFALFIVAIILFAGVPVFFTVYKPATCTDNKQNQGERGVDCGGPCNRLCSADFSEPRVLWTYSSRVVPGVYNAMAYGENPNQSVGAENVSYSIKLYDAQGILVAEKKGRGSIPPGSKFALFEGGIQTGQRIPTRATLEFTSPIDWVPARPYTSLKTISIDVIPDGAGTRAEAKIKNEYVSTIISGIDAFIVLYDKDGNRVAFSKTRIESITPSESQILYFTWPEAVASRVVKTELIFSGSIR